MEQAYQIDKSYRCIGIGGVLGPASLSVSFRGITAYLSSVIGSCAAESGLFSDSSVEMRNGYRFVL